MKRPIMPLSELLAGSSEPRSDRTESRKVINKDGKRSTRRSALFDTLNEGVINRPRPT